MLFLCKKFYMKKIEAHKHYWWGENHQHYPEQNTIIKMNDPRLFIRYNVGDAMFADFEDFYSSIAEVQWIDFKPNEREQKQILTEAWNFLCIEERILEDDLEEIELDEDF